MAHSRPCRGCLSSQMPDEQALHRLMQELWQALPPDQRASSAVYDKRLKLCTACPHLINAMCRHCGCYVEARAMRRWQRCPDLPPRWAAEPEEEVYA